MSGIGRIERTTQDHVSALLRNDLQYRYLRGSFIHSVTTDASRVISRGTEYDVR